MEGKTRILATIAILSVAAVCFIPGPALACFNPTDSFATEVLLNRPGISYDLDEISQTQNVTKVTSDIVYRLHYDLELAVILSQRNLYGSEAEYLSVRIQIPTKSVSYTTWNVDMSLTKPVDMSSLDIEAAKALGWETVSSAGEGPYYRGVFVKDSIAVDILPGQSGEPEETVVRVSVNNATLPLAEQTRGEIATFLVAIGFAVDEESALENAEIQSYSNEWQDLAPATDIDPEQFDWKLAMRTELLWLRDNGVISGLVDSDIDGASFACERGTAGHNSRVVFEDSEWIPYHKTDNPALLRDGDCDGFSIDSLPDGVLEITGASANDGNPSSTTYVWAIVGAATAIGTGTLVWRKRASGRSVS